MPRSRPSSPSTHAQRIARHRPSLSNPISWLSRSSPSTSPIKISQPQLVHDIYLPVSAVANVHPRYGELGSGATVVRTPREALSRLPAPSPNHVPAAADDDASSYEDDPEPASPVSPALPPYPLPSKSSSPSSPLDQLPKSHRPVPISIDHTPPQSPFSSVLLTPLPDILLDPTALIVTLETSTSSLRTTYATLTSRPSHLADYLLSLARASRERERRNFRDTLVEEDEFPTEHEGEGDDHRRDDEQDNNSVDRLSPTAPFTSLFNAHLATTGLLPQSPGAIHIFLDRPSPPYTYILAYLRTPTDHPSLPTALTLHDRLDDLLDLRDEAAYLGLEELHRLCCVAIRIRRGSAGSTNTHTSSSTSGTSSSSMPHDTMHGRGRGDVRIRAVPQHSHERVSAGSVAQSEAAHIESAPASVRAQTPSSVLAHGRSASASRARLAGDWI